LPRKQLQRPTDLVQLEMLLWLRRRRSHRDHAEMFQHGAIDRDSDLAEAPLSE
jgi:hypothetical protein